MTFRRTSYWKTISWDNTHIELASAKRISVLLHYPSAARCNSNKSEQDDRRVYFIFSEYQFKKKKQIPRVQFAFNLVPNKNILI